MTIDELKALGYVFRVAHSKDEACCTVGSERFIKACFGISRDEAIESARQCAVIHFVENRLAGSPPNL